MLQAKEFNYLGDRLLKSENSDDEEIHKKKEFKILQKTKKKLNWRKTGFVLI